MSRETEIWSYVSEVDEQLEFVKQIVSRLEASGIPYMMTGSMAMAIYAIPRMTRDIDLVIECDPDQIDRIAELFEVDCYVDIEEIREAISRRSMFNIIHSKSMIKADFIIRKDEEYRKLEFDRRREFQVEDTRMWVVAPEDLILSKLHWSKTTPSEMHTRDVRTIIETVPDLDWTYLAKWSESLGLSDLLEEAKPE